MKFKSRQLTLHNIIQFPAKLDNARALFEQVYEAGEVFKQMLMGNGYYTSGPIIFTYNPKTPNGLVIMTTIGNKVEIVGQNQSNFSFVEELNLNTDYYYRQYDSNEEIPYEQLEAEIEKDGKRIQNIYHVILNFYGETMIDLYYEVEDI